MVTPIMFMSQYNKYVIELACSVRIGEYWSRSFFVGLWTSPAVWSINLKKKHNSNFY